MGWKSLFRHRILERGYDYYCDNKVNIIKKSDSEVQAEVYGNETYAVRIGLKNGSIEFMECDCPYAMDSNYCKHMAAALYQFMDDDFLDKDSKEDFYIDDLWQRKNEEKKEIENLLKKIPEAEKHLLLIKMLAENSELKNSLKLQYDFKVDAKQMLVFRDEIRDIVSEYSERGFIAWNNAFDFCCSLLNFLDKRIDLLVEKEYLLQAFELTNQIFKLIGTIDMDDSDGGSSMVAERCYEKWLRI